MTSQFHLPSTDAPEPPAGADEPTLTRRRRPGRGIAWIAIGTVVLVVGGVVGAYLTRSPESPRKPAPLDPIQRLSTVPLSSLSAAAASSPKLEAAKSSSEPALADRGKPVMLYIGAEFCPYCAAERWPMVVALSHFGTFTDLQQTHSAVGDGDIATLSFYGSTFRSPYLDFVPVETATNVPSGNYYQTLQTPSAADQAIWQRDEPSGLSLPFVDFGGRWLLESSQYQPSDLSGHSFSSIAKSIGSNANTVGRTIDASAAVLTKYICTITGQQPASTCGAVANVTLPNAAGAGRSSRAG